MPAPSKADLGERIQLVAHRGKQVLVIDFTGCTSPQIQRLSLLVQQRVTAQPPQSVLALADFTGAEIDREAARVIKEVTARDRPHIKRAAWVGTENFPATLLRAISDFSVRQFPTFQTRQEALEWIVED